MRILYVCAVDLARQFAGTVHVLETVGNLRSLGHKVALVAISHGGDTRMASLGSSRAQDAFFMPIPPVPILKAIVFHVLLFVYVFVLVIRHRIEIIYEREIPLGLGVRLPAMLLGIPRVVEVNGLPGDEENVPLPVKFRDRARAAFQRLDLRLASGVIVVTDQMRVSLTSRYALRADRVLVVPNGVNETVFKPMDKAACRNMLGLSPEDRYVCCVSSFHRHHGIDNLVRAAPQVVAESPQVRFLLVGDGVERANCEKMARTERLSEHFIFTGAKPYCSIPSYLCASDVCVFIYRPAYERHVSPLKLYEYLSCARPTLVATRTAHLAGDWGLERDARLFVHVDQVDPESIGRAILHMLEDIEGSEKIGRRGREFVLANRTWAMAARKTEDAIHRLMLRRQGPAHS